MLDDNFFVNFFSNLAHSPEKIKKDLDEYWERGKIKEYYELFYSMNKQYLIIKNPDGKHTIRKR